MSPNYRNDIPSPSPYSIGQKQATYSTHTQKGRVVQGHSRSCCCCSVTKSCPTLCDLMDCSQVPLSSTVSWSLLKFMPIESVMLSNHLILFHSLLLLPSIFPSIRVFLNESVLHIRWPKQWSFSLQLDFGKCTFHVFPVNPSPAPQMCSKAGCLLVSFSPACSVMKRPCSRELLLQVPSRGHLYISKPSSECFSRLSAPSYPVLAGTPSSH